MQGLGWVSIPTCDNRIESRQFNKLVFLKHKLVRFQLFNKSGTLSSKTDLILPLIKHTHSQTHTAEPVSDSIKSLNIKMVPVTSSCGFSGAGGNPALPFEMVMTMMVITSHRTNVYGGPDCFKLRAERKLRWKAIEIMPPSWWQFILFDFNHIENAYGSTTGRRSRSRLPLGMNCAIWNPQLH